MLLDCTCHELLTAYLEMPMGSCSCFFFSSIHCIQIYGLLFGDTLDLVWLPVPAAGLVDLAFGLLACGTAMSVGRCGPSDMARPECWCHGWISPANLAPGGNNPSGSLTNNAMLAALDGDGALDEADAMAASNEKSPVAGHCYEAQVPNGASADNVVQT